MKKIIKGWRLPAGMMFLHTQVILAQQPTQVDLANEKINLEGWMFMGAGIAICLAGILLFFLNKLFTKECIKKEKKEVSKAKAPVQQRKQPSVDKKENRGVAKAKKAQAIDKVPVVKKTTIQKETQIKKDLEGNDAAIQLKLTEVGNASKSIGIHLNEQVIVGRSPQKCNVLIEDDLTVSGAHCKFYVFDNQVYLMDLGSTNGTYVNGTAIQYAVVLKIGDLLGIGAKEYRVSWQ